MCLRIQCKQGCIRGEQPTDVYVKLAATMWQLMLQDFENREANSLSESQRLQQKVVELQHALETASSTADTRSRSTAAQMQLQVESLTADHQSVQNSLKSQVLSLQQHIDSTTQQLQLAHSKLEEEKQSRAADTEHFGAELRKQQGHIVAAEDKAESKSKVVKGQEHELQDLHHQVLFCVTAYIAGQRRSCTSLFDL